MVRKLFTFLMLMAIIPVTTAQVDWEQDWANLKKYQASNAELLKERKFPKVVFMGNSITEEWVQQRPEFFSQNNFVGRGISGQTTPQMLLRFSQDVLDLQPQLVVILAGTNDIAGNTGRATLKSITDNFRAMAQLAQANGIKVVLSSVLPVYQYRWSPQAEPVSQIEAVNSWLQEYAEKNGYEYIDYFPALADEKRGLKEAYSGDGVHPNLEGYKVMEPLALKAIEAALKE